jgi:heavy metal sensor kinase
MRFFKSIKIRLTVWYLIVTVLLLIVFSTVAYLLLSYNLYQDMDNSLKARGAELRTTLSMEFGQAIFATQQNEVLLIYGSDGTLLQRFGPEAEFTSITDQIKQALAGQSLIFTAVTRDGQEYRLYATPFTVNLNTRIAITVGQPTAGIKNVLGAFRDILGISGLAVILLAGAGGLFLANRALKPVERMTRTAQEIGESDLSRRISVHQEDELGRLALTLNGMIERLEAAFNRQRQFTADASHELRTPLAIIQAESTLALSKTRTETEYQKSLEVVSQEVTFMSAIIDKLLFLARSDAGREPLNFEEVNLKELFTKLSADIETLAGDKGLQFRLGPVEDLTVKGDRVKLRQLFLNILENAIRYTPGGGSISGTVTRREEMAVVSITDTGIGIPAEHLPHIFERFYRVDKARSRAEGGTGLGLAIARYIAEVHGGKIEVASQVGQGSTFTVFLPILENN